MTPIIMTPFMNDLERQAMINRCIVHYNDLLEEQRRRYADKAYPLLCDAAREERLGFINNLKQFYGDDFVTDMLEPRPSFLHHGND